LRFWDTSALLSLLLKQEATESLKKILAADKRMVLWWGTKVEVVSGVCRLERAGAIERSAVAKLTEAVAALSSDAYEVQPTEQVRNIACRLLRVHDLRAADAIQLAAGLVWAQHNPTGFSFVCLDRRLREAAEREGFDVVPK